MDTSFLLINKNDESVYGVYNNEPLPNFDDMEAKGFRVEPLAEPFDSAKHAWDGTKVVARIVPGVSQMELDRQSLVASLSVSSVKSDNALAMILSTLRFK